MKKFLGSCLVGLCAFSAWGAGAPLILDWGTLDTSGAAQQKASLALRTAGCATAVQTLSAKGTAPWLVQFDDVIQEEWKGALEAAGAKLKGYIPENAYLVEATPKQLAAIGALDHVAWVGEFLPDYKRSGKVRAKLARVKAAAEADVASAYRVLLFSRDDLVAVAAKIEALAGAAVAAAEGDLIQADLTAAQVEEITGWGEVQWVEPYVRPQLWNDVAVRTNLMGVSNAWSVLGLTGAGQTVAVCDTGLDTGNTGNLHRDFTNRVTGYGWSNGAYSASYSWGDFDSHGSHVCGSVLGNGTMSTGRYKGVAYQANLIIQGSQEDLSGIPTDVNTLFRQAFTNGARIHSDSWGYSDAGYYHTDSRNLDMFTWSNKTMLVLVAAGNQGIDANSDGVVDLDSIGSPGTAKNCLTVGASENDRPEFSSYTWGDSWPDDYPANPIAADEISGAYDNTNQGLAAFSSRGPCDDGRIKPDIVAPGTDIISTRSRSTTNTGWGVVTANTNYLYMGGTSMATPLTAGAVALARQWVTTTGGITNPSGQLLKALLLNGARNMSPGQYGTGSYREIAAVRPSNAQGWGHIDLYNTLQPATNQFLALIDTNSLSTGQTNVFTYSVSSGSTNKIIATMAYADYWGTAGSGKQLINDLDLTVIKPGGTTNYANGRTSVDATNNVEMIELAADEAGTYTVKVVARTVPSGTTQAYALVVRGPEADETPTAPTFGANPGPVSTTTGVAVAFTVATTAGYPAPVLALQGTTASTGYSFTAATGQLNYTPPVADVGTRTFTFTATNASGAATQTVSVVVYEAPPAAPASIWASATNAADFTAAWSSVSGATGYRLDVGTNATFSAGSGGGGPATNCYHSGTLGAGTGGTWTETGLTQGSGYLISLTGDVLITPAMDFTASSAETLNFKARTYGGAVSNNNTITVSVSTDNGGNWTSLGTRTPLNTTLTAMSPFDLSGYEGTQVLVKLETLGATASVGAGIDDVLVTNLAVSSVPAYVPGYSNRTVSGTSQSVTGLTAGATYYFRARAVNGGGTSPNSPTASVTTVGAPGTPPVMNAVTSQAALTGRDVERTVTATQTDGDPILSYACTSAVDAATWDFDAGTGAFLFVPTAAQIGANVFSFTATDKDGASSPVAATVTVSAASAPSLNAIPAQLANVGAMLEYTATATEPDGDAVTFACTSAVAEATWAVDTNGYFLFEPTAAQLGTNVFVFTATDRDGTSAPAAMEVKVYSAAATNDFTQWVEDQEEDPADPDFAAGADVDGDGQTTWQEYVADTDPAASNSVLKLAGNYYIAPQVSNSTGQIRFSFPASPNRYYQLEYCTDLTNHVVGATNLGWGVPGMVVTSDAPATWYGVVRALLDEP